MKIQFYQAKNSDILDVILHGSSPGIEGGFLADHSYRNPITKEPVFEDQAVELVVVA